MSCLQKQPKLSRSEELLHHASSQKTIQISARLLGMLLQKNVFNLYGTTRLYRVRPTCDQGVAIYENIRLLKPDFQLSF